MIIVAKLLIGFNFGTYKLFYTAKVKTHHPPPPNTVVNSLAVYSVLRYITPYIETQ